MQVDQTLVIDLSNSFSTSSNTDSAVSTAVIDKGDCPSLNNVKFWNDESQGVVYAYGGELSDAAPEGSSVPSDSFWKFTPLSSGLGGSWSQVSVTDPNFSALTRPTGGSATWGSVGGFYMGGYSDSKTDQKTTGLTGFVPTPGIQFYNYSSGTWTNSSSAGYLQPGTQEYGAIVHVPTWGPAGMVVAFGGQTSGQSTWSDGGSYVQLANISIFDPHGGQWYYQTASGDVPDQRDRFCAVGAQGGDNSTFGKYFRAASEVFQFLN